ncbi:terminase family protein [Vibrio hannami]|uniref:terminase large subunit domain-containing protein n=1 Tax=Vibrio hannami TaxID=2717094 RepID=UPI002410A309|nr:terminase family protein [Vibrio hannami]MDG3089238.1 terminase family protein [Vibrio hannami]
MPKKSAPTVRQQMERLLHLLEYEAALQDARDDLIRFAEMTMPVERDMSNPHRTRYDAQPHHRLMAKTAMGIESGEAQKEILNAPPRHGKSELCTRRFAAWYWDATPERDIFVATYNENFAGDFGIEIREIIQSQRFKQIFPDFRLKKTAEGRLTNASGGNLYPLGRRSTMTGRGADLIILDDPIKDDKEARNPEAP